MVDLLAGVAVVGCLAAVMVALAVLVRSARWRRVAGPAIAAAMAAHDEAIRTTAYSAFAEVQSQKDREAPIAAPEDH